LKTGRAPSHGGQDNMRPVTHPWCETLQVRDPEDGLKLVLTCARRGTVPERGRPATLLCEFVLYNWVSEGGSGVSPRCGGQEVLVGR
jgi:hypothetical protein